MKISIIVPVYNIEKWLHRCVESVLQQKYVDYELILVDDGATDSSGTICDEYEKNYKQIKVVHKKNGGLSDARNTGVAVSQGEYLLFLDGDDYLKKDCLQQINDAIVKFDYPDMLYSNGNYEFGECKEPTLCNHIAELEEKYLSVLSGNELLAFLLQHGIAGWSAWGKIYRREFWKKNQLCYRRRFMEDIDVSYKFLGLAESVGVIPAYYCYFRGREGSLLSSFRADYLKIYIEILNEWLHDLKKSGNYGQELKQLIYNRFAKEYCEAILGKIYFAKGRERAELLKSVHEINEYLWISDSKQSKMVRTFIHLIGFKNTCFWLNKWKCIKNGMK